MNSVDDRDAPGSESHPGDEGGTVDLLDITLILIHQWRMIAIVSVVMLLGGTAFAFLTKPYYTATAIILPPTQQSSSSALLGQLSSLANLGGGSAALGLKTPEDMYVGILQSRTIADQIIDQFQLQKVYKERKLQDTRNKLKTYTEIENGKDSLIHISVTDKDAQRASDMANAYVDELHKMNSLLAISEAAQRRVFFDKQLEIEKAALSAAEDDLRTTEQKTGVIQLTGQAQVLIQSIAELRAQIASREVELQSDKVYSTDQNPNVVRLQEEISAMRAQLAKMEVSQQPNDPGNISITSSRVPESALEYARKFREVQFHSTLYELLSKQYEAARIDEAKSAPVIQVVDRAVPPDKKAGPKRALIMAGSLFAGFVLACFWALLSKGFSVMNDQPESAEKLSQIRAALRRSEQH